MSDLQSLDTPGLERGGPQEVGRPHDGEVLGGHARVLVVERDAVQVLQQELQRVVVGVRQLGDHLQGENIWYLKKYLFIPKSL